MNHLLPPHPAITTVPPFQVALAPSGGYVVTVTFAPADAAALRTTALPPQRLAQAAQHATGLAHLGSRIQADASGIEVLGVTPPVHLCGLDALWFAACAERDVLQALIADALAAGARLGDAAGGLG